MCGESGPSFVIKYLDDFTDFKLQASKTEIRIHQYLQEKDWGKDYIVRILGVADRPHKMYLEHGVPMDWNDYNFWKGSKKAHLKIFKGVKAGLDFMSVHEVIHRDIKFSNLLIVGVNDPKVKIIDFGCSRILKQGERAMTDIGSPLYKSPSVFMATIMGGYSFECDLWSLGIMMLMTLFGNYEDHPLVGYKRSPTEVMLACTKIDHSFLRECLAETNDDGVYEQTLKKWSEEALEPTLTRRGK